MKPSMEGPMDSGSAVGFGAFQSRRRARREQGRSSSFATFVAVAAAVILLADVAFPSAPAGAAVRNLREAAHVARRYGWRGEGSGSAPRPQHGRDDRRRRPVMHTFFHRIDPNRKGTAMSDAADRELLDAWRRAWDEAGWEPRVLTLDDAKRHPEYSRYAEKLKKVPMMGIGGKGLNIFYNQLCFYRWLAMAVAGGGWMCDYDVFPLTTTIDEGKPIEEGGFRPDDPDRMPNGGDFTVYSVVGNPNPKDGKGKGVPALMSGREIEWLRMALNILENGVHHLDERMWTDFMALMDVAGTYATRDDVVQGHMVLTGEDFGPEHCKITEGKRAVHFSHDALARGKLREGERIGLEYRPMIAKRFLDMWRERCPDQQEQHSLHSGQEAPLMVLRRAAEEEEGKKEQQPEKA